MFVPSLSVTIRNLKETYRVDIIPQKRCSKCGEFFPATREFFYANSGQKSGLVPRCKPCYREGLKPSPVVPEEYKRCSYCHQIHPATIDFFESHKTASDGLNKRCNQCVQRLQDKQSKNSNTTVSPPDNLVYADIPQKYCKGCNQEYPATSQFFHRNKYAQDGLETQCKQCRSLYKSEQHAIRNPKPKKPTPPPGHKFCTKCGVPKLVNKENFRPRTEGGDGFRNICNECMNKQDTERAYKRYQETPPVIDENNIKECSMCGGAYPATLEYFHSNKRKIDGLTSECKLCASKRTKQWRLDHPEEAQLRSIRDRQKYGDRIREYVSWHAKTHKDQKNAARHRRIAKVYGNGGTHTDKDIQAQYMSQNGLCYWCKRKLTKYHVDHVIPVSRGGSNGPENIVIACPYCNRSKGNKTLDEWLPYLEKYILNQEEKEG